MNKHALLTRDVWSVMGLPFDAVNILDAIKQLDNNISQRKFCFLSTPNLNFVIASQSDDVFFQSVVDSDLSVADGMPLIWVAKILGIPLSERVAGSTLFDELSNQDSVTSKIKVFFFGGQAGIAKEADQQLTASSQSMISCGFYDPGFVSVDEMSTSEITTYINGKDPDFIVVALGARKGQEWIQKNKHELKAPVISHLGAVINFVAGNVERAPIIWQRCGLEWLWRIRQEPTLWKRYLFDGLTFIKLITINVIPLAIYDRILRRATSFKQLCHIGIRKEDRILMELTGSIHHHVLGQVKQAFSQVVENEETDVVINCHALKYIDSAFIATALLFQRYLAEQERTLELNNVPKRIVNILSLSGALKRFTLTSNQS